MQGLTPYNHNINSYGGDGNGYGDTPRYVFRKPKRQFYFNRIAVLIIAVCLITAGALWLFNRTTGNLELNDYSIYFTGIYCTTDTTAPENTVVFDLYDNEFLIGAGGSDATTRYFIADKVYFELHEAESDIVEAFDNGFSRKLLVFSAKNITVTADKSREINSSITRQYNEAYAFLLQLHEFFTDAASKNVSKELFEYKSASICEGVNDRIIGLIGDKNALSASLTYYYALTLSDIANIRGHYNDTDFLKSLTLKTSFSFYLAVRTIS